MISLRGILPCKRYAGGDFLKTVLITGGSRGIGRAAAKLFSQAHYNVVINYLHSKSEAETLASSLPNAVATQADVSDSTQAQALVARATEIFGTIDVLINNAGIAQQKLFTDITEEDWSRMMAVNVTGVFHCCRFVLPQMIRRKSGVIVNVSSMWGQVGASCEVHYSASKAAVIGLTKALAKEVGPSGIRVNCVAPGVIDTDMNRALSAEDRRELAEETPLERIGTPEEAAQAILFLASDAASFITGQVLAANGGIVI